MAALDSIATNPDLGASPGRLALHRHRGSLLVAQRGTETVVEVRVAAGCHREDSSSGRDVNVLRITCWGPSSTNHPEIRLIWLRTARTIASPWTCNSELPE
jgi:hypothetical protein